MAALADVGAEPLLRYRCLAGFVGEEAALEFQTWEQSLDRPDREEWRLKAQMSRSLPVHLGPQLNIPPPRDQGMVASAAVVDRVKNRSCAQRQAHGSPLAGRGGLLCRSGEVLTGVRDCRGRPASLRRALRLRVGQGTGGFQ
jgi:hypothetical protein